MKNKEILGDFIVNNELDIDMLVNKYYEYIYSIVKNSINTVITNEDIEEIISDTFLAVWKNYNALKREMLITPYLVGVTKNIIKNKYRTTKIDYSISDYEGTLKDIISIEELYEEKEQNQIMINTLKTVKTQAYQIFIMFYYNNMKIKDISKELNVSESKVKVELYRIRKEIKKNLKNGGYGYGK